MYLSCSNNRSSNTLIYSFRQNILIIFVFVSREWCQTSGELLLPGDYTSLGMWIDMKLVFSVLWRQNLLLGTSLADFTKNTFAITRTKLTNLDDFSFLAIFVAALHAFGVLLAVKLISKVKLFSTLLLPPNAIMKNLTLHCFIVKY